MSEDTQPTQLEQEMHFVACRLREQYDLDTVVILACKQENNGKQCETTASYALSGNHYAGMHLARRYSK